MCILMADSHCCMVETNNGEVIFLRFKKKKHEKQNSKLRMSAKDGDEVLQGRCWRGGGPRRPIQPLELWGP